MITINDINRAIKSADYAGYKATVKDISYVLLCMQYSDNRVAYKSIFGIDVEDSEIEEYDSSKKILHIKSYVDRKFSDKIPVLSAGKEPDLNVKNLSKEITFEENKAALIDLLQTIDENMRAGYITPKDGIKMQTDIRTKLNDKFEVEKTDGAQYIIVEKKFNFICPHLRKECYIYTKEDLMEKYGLIEKPQEDANI